MDINKYSPIGKIGKNHLISLSAYSEEEIFEILSLAENIAKAISVGEKPSFLKNKKIALIAKNGQLSQRIAFESAVSALSGKAVVCSMSGSEIESLVADPLSVAAIVGYGVNALVVQTSEPNDALSLEKLSNLPVINANGKCGPCEALSALLTFWRKRGRLGNATIAMIGDPNAYADSFAYAFAICGFDIRFICPKELASEKLINFCRQFGEAEVCEDMCSGLKGVDAVFVSDDSLGEKFVLNENAYAACYGAAIFHALPVSAGVGITETLIDNPNFYALDEALALPEIEMAALTLLMKK